MVDAYVAARCPTQFFKCLPERRHIGLRIPIVLGTRGQGIWLLRGATSRCLNVSFCALSYIDVIGVLSDLFILRGIPAHIRSDNGPEFVAKAVQDWIAVVGAKTAYIERGSPWENGYIESFNARLRDELLDGEIFYSLREARIVIESWRRHYNTIRPYASLGYCLRRVAGCATPSGSASHAGETVNLKLTFHLAHSAGADHIAVAKSLCFNRYLQGRVCKTWRATARPSFATSVLRVWSEEQNAWIRAIRTCAPDAIERS